MEFTIINGIKITINVKYKFLITSDLSKIESSNEMVNKIEIYNVYVLFKLNMATITQMIIIEIVIALVILLLSFKLGKYKTIASCKKILA